MSSGRRDFGCYVRREDERVPAHRAVKRRKPKYPLPAADDQPDFANSPLPAAMLAVAKEDLPQNRQILYQSMLETWFVVPTKEETHDKPGFSAVPANVADSFSLEHNSEASWWRWRLLMRKRSAIGTRASPGSRCRELRSFRQWRAQMRKRSSSIRTSLKILTQR